MLTKVTQEFLSKEPNDEEMMAFLDEHIYAKHLVPDDILSIIERLNDEKNKHKTIYKYVVSDILSSNMERVLNIILNIKDQRTSEIAEPKYGLYEFPKNCISIKSPITKIEPPPSIFEIINVLTEGTNTMVMPERTPGRERGRITRRNTLKELAPRSLAASIRDLSSLMMTE